ncbi:MAG: hypothetical protein FVQ84_19570 [Planctomycetes bacterium]|nr:hypothetical protein [Planctomycetota bacterium]
MTLTKGRRRDVNSMSMRRMMVIAGMIWLGLLQVSCGAEKIVLRLKPSEVRQEIDGFGASGAWWAQIVGGWDESKRKEIAGLSGETAGQWICAETVG